MEIADRRYELIENYRDEMMKEKSQDASMNWDAKDKAAYTSNTNGLQKKEITLLLITAIPLVD